MLVPFPFISDKSKISLLIWITSVFTSSFYPSQCESYVGRGGDSALHWGHCPFWPRHDCHAAAVAHIPPGCWSLTILNNPNEVETITVPISQVRKRKHRVMEPVQGHPASKNSRWDSNPVFFFYSSHYEQLCQTWIGGIQSLSSCAFCHDQGHEFSGKK